MNRFIWTIAIPSISIFNIALVAMELGSHIIKSDAIVLQRYKSAVKTMVDTGKTIENWKENKAVIKYLEEHDRIMNEQEPVDLFNTDTCCEVNICLNYVQNNENFKKALADFKSSIFLDSISSIRKYDYAKTIQLREIAAQSMMNFLISKGLRFPAYPENTSAGFLKANENISIDTGSYLIPGFLLLYYFRYIPPEAIETSCSGYKIISAKSM